MSPSSWTALRETAELSTYAIKARLPLSWVMDQNGFPVLETDPDGRMHCLCPFHQDTAPSFDIFGERWGCFPCGVTGDVFDLLKRFSVSFTFGQVKAEALRLLSGLPVGWQPDTVTPFTSDPKELLRRVVNSQVDGWVLERIAAHYGWPPANFLRERWRVGSEWNQVIVPYYSREGELVTYKRRAIGTHTVAAAGVPISALYGDWLDMDPGRPVLLCEGESDTWAADYTLRSYYAVLGIPGAGTRPNVSGLEGREIYLAFDGDRSGVTARTIWAPALESAGCTVGHIRVDEGTDLRDLLYPKPEVD